MKIKSVKAVPPIKLSAQEIDALAVELLGAKEQKERYEGRETELKDQVFILTDKQGVVRGEKKVLLGDAFDLGYTNCAGRTYADEAVAAKILEPKKVLSQCYSLVFDEKKFTKLVDTGIITASQAKKILKRGAGFKRLSLVRKKQEGE